MVNDLKNKIIVIFNKVKQLNKLSFIVIGCLIFILVQFVFPIKEYGSSSNVSGSLYPAEILKNDTNYSQIVKCGLYDVDTLEIKFSTYNIVNREGKIRVKIKNLNTGKKYEKDINLIDLHDNMFYPFNFKEKICNINQKIEVSFSYIDYDENNSLTYWFQRDNINNNMKINNKKVSQELYVVMYGKGIDRTVIWYPLIIIVVCGLVSCTVGGEENERKIKK